MPALQMGSNGFTNGLFGSALLFCLSLALHLAFTVGAKWQPVKDVQWEQSEL